MNLSLKQKRFCDEYLIDLNATQAAIRAGYSKKTAREQASRLLSNVNVQAYIQEQMKARSERTQISQDKVLQDIETVKQDAMAGDMNHAAALKACELQGKHLGMFIDRTINTNTSLADLLALSKQ